jgi:hypothetical protein
MWSKSMAKSMSSESNTAWLSRDFDRTAVLISAAILIVAAFLYVRPGVFVVSIMLNDTLLYTESGYRLAHGQVPSIDFSSALGIFAFLPHAIAYRLTGDLVQAIPIASVMLAAVVFAIAVYFALTRLGAIVGISVTLTTSLLVMAPVVLAYGFWEGEGVQTSIAMSYNRLGFVLVLLTALLPIKPKPQWRVVADRFDAVLAVVVFTVAYYTKMPFGIAVACLVAFWGLLLQPDRRQLMVFVIGAALAMAAMEMVLPGLNLAYVKDMGISLAVIPNHGLKDYVYLSAAVLREVLILAGLPLMAVLAVGRANPRHIAFYICLIGGSIILLSQCVQTSYLVPTLAIPIATVTLIAGTEGNRNRLAIWVAVAALTYGLITYMVPSLLSIRSNTPDARTSTIAGLPQAYASLRIRTEKGFDLGEMDDTVGKRISPAEVFPAARSPIPAGLFYGQSLSLNGYAHTLVNLVVARNLCGKAADRTAVLDFANLSSSLFGHPPVSGYTYAHFGRSFGLSAHWEPERMFWGVDCLLNPKLPLDPTNNAGLWSVYGPYLTKKFLLTGETDYWRVLVRRDKL